jgi:hypothetical protein
MAQINFCGPSYRSQSPNADDERCANLYVETLEANGKSQYALYPTAGLKLVTTIPGNLPIDAMVLQEGTFNGGIGIARPVEGVCGTFFFSLQYQGGGAFTAITENSFTRAAFLGSRFVYMAAGAGASIMTVDGNVFYYTGAPHAVAAANFNNLPVSQVGYCDGFYLALNQNSNQWYASAPLDPATWPGASTAKVSVFPDNVIAMVVNQRQVWMLGNSASQVYYNSGNFPFPFDIVQGGYIEAGCAAAGSAVKLDNSIFWIGNDQRGNALVWRANGYTPQRVSNHAVEFAMQSYPQVTDAKAYAFQDQGHSFYQIYFPSANSGRGATWVYDVATGMWHERFYLDPVTGMEFAHRSQNHAFFNSIAPSVNFDGMAYHLVGDWQNTGHIYQMNIPTFNGSSWDFADDFGNPIERIRRTPYVNIEKEWMLHHQFELDMETGLGPIPPLHGAFDAPSVAILPDFTTPTDAWRVQITDGGAIVSAFLGASASETIILNHKGISYQLTVNAGPVHPVPVTFSPVYPVIFPMATSGTLLQSGLEVTG